MTATDIMLLAVVLYAVHRWATNKPVATAETVVGGVFAILVIAMLDTGRTAEIARGFAWLFLLAGAYNAIGPIAAAAKAKSKSTTAAVPAVVIA